MKRLFITGTDTGVGKTHVTAALARHARHLGLRVFAFKPIETGQSSREHPDSDQRILCEAAGDWQTGAMRGVYRLATPVAPLVASQLEHVDIDLDLVVRTVETGSAQIDLTLIEGAGGWRVPLTPQHDIAELARRLCCPVLVVARGGLGAINHSLLTLEAIERDGMVVAGLVISLRPDDARGLAESNVEQIGRRWRGPIVLFDGNSEKLSHFT